MPLLVALLLACGSPPPPPAAPLKPPAPILDARACPAVLAAGDRLPPLRPKDATDDWEIGTVGTRRGLVVGVYSHLGGASRPRLLRDIRKALQAEVPRELLVHFDGSPCIGPADIRSTKDSLQVDCVEDAPTLAKVIVEQLDGFDASRVGVVWSSRGTGTRGTRRDE